MLRLFFLLLGIVIGGIGGLMAAGVVDDGGYDWESFTIVGGFFLGVALILQVIQFIVLLIDRSRTKQALAGHAAGSGPCALCQQEAERIAVYINASKRRWADSDHVQSTSGWVHADVCAPCHSRMYQLSRASMTAGGTTVWLVMAGIFGVLLTFVGGVAGPILIGIAVIFFVLLQFWLNRRYNSILGELAAQLKESIGVTIWNPLADKIEFGSRHVSQGE